ncbi:MAG: signal peptidase II [Spirochaetes bacterium]|nr:MAG: signal peptidase II [Spirochaetota bacterium]
MRKYRYFLLSAIIVAADQITKILVEKLIPPYTIAWSFAGDFFRLIHVKNQGAAFSMGNGFSDALRIGLFIVVPLLVLSAVGFYLVRGKDLTNGQRWILAAIIGGGVGNQIDRIFRPAGVVDFLDFKFYGLFGLERWPTFNIADASLVVSSILLIILLIRQELQMRKL